MTLVLIGVFLFFYYLLGAIHDHFVQIDIEKHSDSLSPERKAWHAAQFFQAVLLLLFLCSACILNLQFYFSLYRLVLLFILIRRVMYEHFKNVLDGNGVFYVDKNFIGSKIHWIADKIGIPVEIISLVSTLILIALIFIV